MGLVRREGRSQISGRYVRPVATESVACALTSERIGGLADEVYYYPQVEAHPSPARPPAGDIHGVSTVYIDRRWLHSIRLRQI